MDLRGVDRFKLTIAVVGGSVVLCVATLGRVEGIGEIMRFVLGPEPALSKPDTRKSGIEGVVNKPEGVPILLRKEK